MCKASAIAFGLMLMSVPRMGAIDFSREIQPILSDRCYFCHGPDEKNNKADLRLDTAEGAREVLKNGELRVRILSDDKDEIMPPPKSKLKLTAAERDLIRRWIDDGGKYEQHWAFVAPRQDIPLPAVSDPAMAEGDAGSLHPGPAGCGKTAACTACGWAALAAARHFRSHGSAAVGGGDRGFFERR